MSTQNSNPQQDSNTGDDKNIDITRSQNRQSTGPESAQDDSDRHEGDGAESGSGHPQNMTHTGGHQEGEYNKDEDQSSEAGSDAGKPSMSNE